MTQSSKPFADFLAQRTTFDLSAFDLIGIGCDLVALIRMKQLLEKWGQKFGDRILSADENRVWQGRNFSAAYLAKRWAVKEAVVKSLGTGFSKGMKWRDISVLNNEDGQPFIQLSGSTQQMMSLHGILFQVSLSDEKEHAMGFAVALRKRSNVKE